MYIIEKIIKLYLKCTNKEVIIPTPNDDSNVELEDVITCKHTFMPIDSTGKIREMELLTSFIEKFLQDNYNYNPDVKKIMQESIDAWKSWYKGNVKKFHNYFTKISTKFYI